MPFGTNRGLILSLPLLSLRSSCTKDGKPYIHLDWNVSVLEIRVTLRLLAPYLLALITFIK